MNLTAEHLVKKYKNRVVVKDISLEITPGKILGLLGPNGAGKSTTIKMLSGQIKPTEGRITINKKTYSSVPEKFRGQVGVMPQEIIIWDDLTVKENLYFSGRLQSLDKRLLEQRVTYLINALDLSRELNTLARNLSGGYKRRLNLANTIIHNPRLIFLDEPTPGIDPHSRNFLWEFIKELKADGKYSMVLTDHNLTEAEKLADYVVIIDEGVIVAEGTVNELKKQFSDGKIIRIEFPEKVLKSKNFERFFNEVKYKYSNVKQIKNLVTVIEDDIGKGIKHILELLESLSLETIDVSINEITLEDVFLIITGKEIRE